MKIEELKQGQAVWVKGYVDRSVFGGCGGFINFYNQDGNHCGHISRNNVREMKEEDVQIDQPKLKIPQFMLDWVDDSREYDYEFDEWFEYNNQPREVYEWLNPENKRQADLNALALMTLIVNGPDAVTVEKEKLYTVGILDKTLVKVIKEDGSYFYKLSSYFLDSKMQILRNLTESEIKEADERLWQWAKEVTE